MKQIKNINSKCNREENKDFCKIWLDPMSLSVKQIRETIRDFDCAVTFNLNSEDDDDLLAGFTAILVEDILEMDSISEEEKDESILELIRKPFRIKKLKEIAQRTIDQIDADVANYEKIALERGYCHKLVRKLVDG